MMEVSQFIPMEVGLVSVLCPLHVHMYFHMNPPQAGRTKMSEPFYWYLSYTVKSTGNQLLVPIHKFVFPSCALYFYLSR